jgi:hypothetical protein
MLFRNSRRRIAVDIIGSGTENPTFNLTNRYRWVALCLISWMSAVGGCVADSKSVSDLAGCPCVDNPAVAPSGPSKTSLFSHHLSGHLSLINDQRLRTLAHRTERNNYGSEGWGFESLRARKGLATELTRSRRQNSVAVRRRDQYRMENGTVMAMFGCHLCAVVAAGRGRPGSPPSRGGRELVRAAAGSQPG